MKKTKIVVNEDMLDAETLRAALQWCQSMEEYHICQYLDPEGREYGKAFHFGKAEGISYVLEYLERAGIIKREAADENKS